MKHLALVLLLIPVAAAFAAYDGWSDPILIADVNGSGGPDIVGVWDSGVATANDFEEYNVSPFPFGIHESVLGMAAIGNIDGDDNAELVFTAGDKIVAIELDGDADDIEWGQWGHDAGHSNTNSE